MNPWVLHLIWGLVLAGCGVALLGRWIRSRLQLQALALVLALWAGVPGPWGAVHWLGMAFQAPSWVSVQLCAFVLWQRWRGVDTAHVALAKRPSNALLLLLGVVTGWLLLLDTFAVFPFAIYASGGTPWVVAGVAAAACLPWVLRGEFSLADPRPFMGVVAVLLFLATSLPTGNVWDAVLDPGLWLVLQWVGIRALIKRYQKQS
jgi:hypothetical protein